MALLQIVLNNADKPKEINFKGLTDLVTTVDEASERAILDTIQQEFADHAILGEEGGVFGKIMLILNTVFFRFYDFRKHIF